MAVSIIPGPKLIAIKKLFNATETHIVFIKRRGCVDFSIQPRFYLYVSNSFSVYFGLIVKKVR